jgi:hypothetical protein
MQLRNMQSGTFQWEAAVPPVLMLDPLPVDLVLHEDRGS